MRLSTGEKYLSKEKILSRTTLIESNLLRDLNSLCSCCWETGNIIDSDILINKPTVDYCSEMPPKSL